MTNEKKEKQLKAKLNKERYLLEELLGHFLWSDWAPRHPAVRQLINIENCMLRIQTLRNKIEAL